MSPPTEGIESVSIVTNSPDAEIGNVAGASVNVITKSGTNSFHGSAFEDHTDKSLKAQNLFQTVGIEEAAYIFNQYGASLGGPIRKNKLFFFGDWEGLKRRQNAAAYQDRDQSRPAYSMPRATLISHPGSRTALPAPVASTTPPPAMPTEPCARRFRATSSPPPGSIRRPKRSSAASARAAS